ncbi:aminotransferase class V-fold PLP-dependent enzyme [Zooshikella marina]|uniref:pyridoxal phosphate-dependent decarboxylase family protein n=1 Tax=Zooshikella ganghwensis TaxID=202772 RepID=UPI001BAE8D29|nr:aminotransferase class V-fold PLP-dependent enzyme [Zooshikella ganghwensis]MBU2708137.1 aminotransferase class V-fold PLP-dependent enzyme [Zooshikella ganghwensis]
MSKQDALSFIDKIFKILDHSGYIKSTSPPLPDNFEQILVACANALLNNDPVYSKQYIAQMNTIPSSIAQAAYILAMQFNPNNQSAEGGRASIAMELSAISAIAAMFNWKQQYHGHLTSGGSLSNLEALWVTIQLTQKSSILISHHSHYNIARLGSMIGANIEYIPCDIEGNWDMLWLADRLKLNDVGAIVLTAGTTGLGKVEPISKVIQLKLQYNFKVHIDAAYGGYFILADNLSEESQSNFSAITQADSITIDPHKLGMQPLGCSCILYKNPGDMSVLTHDSPYTYYDTSTIALGKFCLECSRSGAAAVALWATTQCYPLIKNGEFAFILSQMRNAALKLTYFFSQNKQFIYFKPDLNIVVFAPGQFITIKTSHYSNQLQQFLLSKKIHVALLTLDGHLISSDPALASEKITLIRVCFMKSEHNDFVETLCKALSEFMSTKYKVEHRDQLTEV